MHKLSILSYDDFSPELKESYYKQEYDYAVKVINTFTEVDADYKFYPTKEIDAAFRAIDKEDNIRYYSGKSVCGHTGMLIRRILNLKSLQQHDYTDGCNWIASPNGLRFL